MTRNKIIIGVSGLLVISAGLFFCFLQIDRRNRSTEDTIEENGKIDVVEEAVVFSEEEMAAIEGSYEDQDPYYDLSSEGRLESDITVQVEEIFMIQNKLKTNSKKITVENQENIPITVYLYNTLRPESSIQEMDIEPLETGIFSNLTARYRYLVGVASAEDARLKITLSD